MVKEKISPYKSPGILVANHGPFAWGITYKELLKNIEAIEIIAKLAYKSLNINTNIKISRDLIEKHFMRKNGKKSYYGQ